MITLHPVCEKDTGRVRVDAKASERLCALQLLEMRQERKVEGNKPTLAEQGSSLAHHKLQILSNCRDLRSVLVFKDYSPCNVPSRL